MSFFKEIFKTNQPSKLLHFIWLGDAIPTPRLLKIIDAAIDNPDFESYFWTSNVERTLPENTLNELRIMSGYAIERHENSIRAKSSTKNSIRIIVRNIEEFLQRYSDYVGNIIKYEATELDAPYGYGAASDILRYYVLWNLGGVYYDSDDNVPGGLSHIIKGSYRLYNKQMILTGATGNNILCSFKNGDYISIILENCIKNYYGNKFVAENLEKNKELSDAASNISQAMKKDMYISNYIKAQRCADVLTKSGPKMLELYLSWDFFHVQSELVAPGGIESDKDWLYTKKSLVISEEVIMNLIKKICEKITFDVNNEGVLNVEEYYSALYLKIEDNQFNKFIQERFVPEIKSLLRNTDFLSQVRYVQSSSSYIEISKLYNKHFSPEILYTKMKSWTDKENKYLYCPVIHHEFIKHINDVYDFLTTTTEISLPPQLNDGFTLEGLKKNLLDNIEDLDNRIKKAQITSSQKVLRIMEDLKTEIITSPKSPPNTKISQMIEKISSLMTYLEGTELLKNIREIDEREKKLLYTFRQKNGRSIFDSLIEEIKKLSRFSRMGIVADIHDTEETQILNYYDLQVDDR